MMPPHFCQIQIKRVETFKVAKTKNANDFLTKEQAKFVYKKSKH